MAKALQVLALTAARSGEVRGMTWDEADLDARLWIVPAARMKAGRKHRVPLTELRKAPLADLLRLDGCALVSFSPKGTALSDMTLSALMRRNRFR